MSGPEGNWARDSGYKCALVDSREILFELRAVWMKQHTRAVQRAERSEIGRSSGGILALNQLQERFDKLIDEY